MRIAIPLLFLVGCIDTIGPFVRDVSMRSDGSIKLTRCEIELHRNIITGTTLEEGSCSVDVRKP